MFARLGAKIVLVTVVVALVFFGIGLLGLALATLLTPYCGIAGGYAVAGAVLLGPVLLWAAIVSASRPPKPPVRAGGGRDLMNSLFTALARETPWAAVASAGLIGALNLFLNRNKTKK
jgi:hypothetical protein